jgi:hypothetical protein
LLFVREIREGLMIVTLDGSGLLERPMKVYPTLLSKMPLLGWQLLPVLRLVISPRVKRESWFQVSYVSSLTIAPYSMLPLPHTIHSSRSARESFHLFLAVEFKLINSGDHTETQYSQDYG